MFYLRLSHIPALALFASLAYPTLADSALSQESVFPLQQNAGTTELFPMPSCHGFTLEEATMDQMQAAMSSGQLTSKQLVMCYMKRIYQTDQYIKYVNTLFALSSKSCVFLLDRAESLIWDES